MDQLNVMANSLRKPVTVLHSHQHLELGIHRSAPSSLLFSSSLRPLVVAEVCDDHAVQVLVAALVPILTLSIARLPVAIREPRILRRLAAPGAQPPLTRAFIAQRPVGENDGFELAPAAVALVVAQPRLVLAELKPPLDLWWCGWDGGNQ